MIDQVPSKTALIVSLLMIWAGKSDPKLVPTGAVAAQMELLRNFRQLSPSSSLSVLLPPPCFLFHTWVANTIRFLMNTIVMPKLVDGIGIRKVFMEKCVRNFLNSKKPVAAAAQVLVVAAGYDTLAYRLAPEFPGVSFFEIDHPATSSVKKAAIHDMRRNQTGSKTTDAPHPCSNLHLIAADLTVHKLSQILDDLPQYDKTKPTIAIVEGLTFYLEEQNVRKLFQELLWVGGSGSQVAFDHFRLKKTGGTTTTTTTTTSSSTTTFDNGWMTSILSAIVSRMGEKFHWGIDPEQLQDFFLGLDESDGTNKHWWTVIEKMPRVGLEHCALLELAATRSTA